MSRIQSNRRVLFAVAIAIGLVCCGWIVAYSWVLNFPWFYYDGWVGIIALLGLSKLLWRRAAWLNLGANTLILLIIGLAIADVVVRWKFWRMEQLAETSSPRERIYSFDQAKADPLQFRVWWDRFVREWRRVADEITMPDPENRLPFQLKPGSESYFFDSLFSINSLGFRDREFRTEKRGSYRIVAIGESTTMGVTLKEDGVPWPALLERMIREEIGGSRPVQVINAGVAAYNLRDNLIRLREQVLPLKPDMIIACHGYNSFVFFDRAKWVRQPRPPEREDRPSRFLAEVEYRAKLLRFRQRHFRRELTPEQFSKLQSEVMASESARLHRELIAVAREHGIKLVLLSYNMAVDRDSPFEVVNFYAGAFPDVRYRVQANRLQTWMLEQLAAEHPDVLYIDTSEGLDGCHEHFIDLMHYTQSGREIFAQNVFRALRDPLEESLVGADLTEDAVPIIRKAWLR